MTNDKAPRDLTLPEFGIVVDAPDYKALLRENEALRAELLAAREALAEIKDGNYWTERDAGLGLNLPLAECIAEKALARIDKFLAKP